METKVKICDREATVTVEQRSNALWYAFGEYMGDEIEAEGYTQPEALKAWQEAARDKAEN